MNEVKIMFSVTSSFEIANISELRTKSSELIRKIAAKKRIIVTRNNEPSMVILNYDEYQELIDLIEKYEDEHFGRIAADRMTSFKKDEAISLKDVETMVGL